MNSKLRSSAGSPKVLLAVRDLRDEVRAGLGAAHVAVRTLDGVSLTVHGGELVIVLGGVASGATSLLSAIAGRPTVGGERHATAALQIRRARIGEHAFLALRRAWSDHAPDIVSSEARTPVLYLFRVRRVALSSAPEESGQWYTWARALRARGHSILVHLTPDADGVSSMPQTHTPAVWEHTAGAEARGGGDRGVRELTLAAGQIVSAVPVTRRWWSPDSDGSAPTTPCDPCQTTWPAP